MSVFDLGAGLASFVFDNSGAGNAVISSIYFDVVDAGSGDRGRLRVDSAVA